MNARQRFIDVLNGNLSGLDRLPMIEWAPWWDLTLNRWKKEGLETDGIYENLCNDFGLDVTSVLTCSPIGKDCPAAKGFGMPIIESEKDYDQILSCLYTDQNIDKAVKRAKNLKKRHDNGEIIIRLWLDGFFWFPRVLFGIESHMYAFYDFPDFMKRINSDLTEYYIKAIDVIFQILKPDMVGFGEDMSYNKGPMLSKEMFNEFIIPYYNLIVPHIKKKNTKVFIDSDGDITEMIPWLIDAGVDGVFPLERQSGVDINHIKERYPELLMMGGFDKMVMHKGEKAMRNEFNRILPVMKSGGYIPSVDHQTPPEVSLDNYFVYLKLFKEYAQKAVY